MQTKYFLPGTDQQIRFLEEQIKIEGMSVLIIGAGSEQIALDMISANASSVQMIVDDYDSLLKARLLLTAEKNIPVKLMDFDNTDFNNSSFDLIYAQASVSSQQRNKVIKEIKRILKPDGYLCVGENIHLTDKPPMFIKEIHDASGIVPLFLNDIDKYYIDRKFEIIFKKDLSYTLKDFYRTSSAILNEKSESLTDQEKSYHKKMLKKMSHEPNAYLKLGGDKYIGFLMLILRKAA